MATSSLFLTTVLVLHALVSCAHGAVVKVCNGRLSYAQCSNCCALRKGCMYLEPITGNPTCIGGELRACPRNCDKAGPKLMVCPSETSDALGVTNVEIVSGKLPPPETGCKYYNLKNGDFVPKMGEIQELEKKKCKVDSLVQICNGEISSKNCGCCGGEKGCLFLENESANATCLPRRNGICPLICRPTVSVCSKSVGFQGTTLESCTNKRQTCEEMSPGCSLYDRGTGADKCAADALIKKYGEA